MDDSEAQERISALFGLIKGINPHDEKLTNQEKLELIYTRETILEEKIEEALDLIKDDPKLEKEMDEIPRLNYLLECIKRTLES